MELRCLVRPAAATAQLFSSASARGSTTFALPLVVSRGHKTTARTKRSLKIAPHDSFLPDRTRPFPVPDAIIYNPPASEAPPSHTPYLFLPDSDPRKVVLKQAREQRQLLSSSSYSTAAPSGSAAAAAPAAVDGYAEDWDELPPAMDYSRRNPTYHVTQEQMAEMRRLRFENPLEWSNIKLAKKFNCSTVFTRMVTEAPRQHKAFLEKKLDVMKSRWGPKKSAARINKARQWDMLYKGEL